MNIVWQIYLYWGFAFIITATKLIASVAFLAELKMLIFQFSMYQTWDSNKGDFAAMKEGIYGNGIHDTYFGMKLPRREMVF